MHGFGSDEFWDIIEQVKDNFSDGFLNGLEQTLKDVVFWIMSWKIWEVYNVTDLIRRLLTSGKFNLSFVITNILGTK